MGRLEVVADVGEQRWAPGEPMAHSGQAHVHGRARAGSRMIVRIADPGPGCTKAVPSREPTTVTDRGPSGVVTQLVPWADTDPRADGGTGSTLSPVASLMDPLTVVVVPCW